jgi:hypothetical protein
MHLSDGTVLKVHGENPELSKIDTKVWTDISEFKTTNKVCSENPKPSKEQDYLILEKQDRNGARYELMASGNFFRFLKKSDGSELKCQITSGVKDFKMSGHKRDMSLLYFVKTVSGEDDLLKLDAAATYDGGNSCPKTTSYKILDNLSTVNGDYRYSIVSNSSSVDATEIFMFAKAADKVIGFGLGSVIWEWPKASSYSLNACFGSDAKSFNNYVAFLLYEDSGKLLKIHGQDPYGKSKEDQLSWNNYADFRAKYDVCGPSGTTPNEPKPKPDSNPKESIMYGLYNPNADLYFLTASRGEYDVVAASGYEKKDGLCFKVYESDPKIPDLVPFFRLYNSNVGRHYYTASVGERDSLRTAGDDLAAGPQTCSDPYPAAGKAKFWCLEGSPGAIYMDFAVGLKPIRRFYSPPPVGTGGHLFTTEPDLVFAERYSKDYQKNPEWQAKWQEHSYFGYSAGYVQCP